MASGGVVSHLQVKFSTTQQQYAIPDSPYSVPASVSTAELSALVNSVLKPDASEFEHVSFDFLVNGHFLRTNLEEYVNEHSISTETVIEIQYLERRPAPEPEDSLQHDDWVSAIHASNDCILTGCYDNTIRVWNTEGDLLITIPGHGAPVKCVRWLTNDDEQPLKTFLTGSHDQSVLLWQWNEQQNAVECLHICRGHGGSVDCVAVDPSRNRFCTGSWDKMLKIWSAVPNPNEDSQTDEVGEAPSKKKKTDGAKVPTRVPIMTLSGHNEGVSSSLWFSEKEVCTGSWDHTIRIWDIEHTSEVHCINGSKVVFSISYSPFNKTLIAGSADRHIRLYDPRNKDGAIVKCSFTSHNAWVSSVCWSQTDENLFISGSYDHLVKLWDVRSPQAPLYDLKGHDNKVLAVDWTMPQYMISGGADNALKIFKYNDSSFHTQQ